MQDYNGSDTLTITTNDNGHTGTGGPKTAVDTIAINVTDRDSVRDAVTGELGERKVELKARQTDDLRDRQREACDALRENRDVLYQDLLQRQREERGALSAGADDRMRATA